MGAIHMNYHAVKKEDQASNPMCQTWGLSEFCHRVWKERHKAFLEDELCHNNIG